MQIDSNLQPSDIAMVKQAYEQKAEAEKTIRKTLIRPQEPQIIDATQYTHAGNADWFVRLHGRNVRYVRDWKKWAVWGGKTWEQFETEDLTYMVVQLTQEMYNLAETLSDSSAADLLRKHAKATQSTSNIIATLKQAKNNKSIQATPDDFDMKPWLFNVQNGTIDLKTGDLQTHSRDDMLTQISPHEYHIERNRPAAWLQFLDDLFGDHPGIIEYLQRKYGYILTGDTSEEEIDILQGLGGNGKTTIINAIAHVMGKDYYEKVNIETIQSTGQKKGGGNASPDVSCLKNKRYITTAEPEHNIVLNMALLKDFTGKDGIKARSLYQKPETFMPVFKLQIPTNFDLILKTQDVGTWRRLKKLQFSKQFLTINKRLDELLKAEAVEILSWQVEGCIKWQQSGLQVPEEILKSTAEYKDEMDSLADFFTLWCERDSSAFVQQLMAYEAYCIYCRNTKEYQMSSVAFSKALKERGLAILDRKDGHRILKYMRLNQKALEALQNPDAIPYELLGTLPMVANGVLSEVKPSPINSELRKLIKHNCGDNPTRYEVDTYLKVYHEDDIEDDARAKIVAAYLTPAQEDDVMFVGMGKNQRDRLKTIRDIIRDNQGRGAVTTETIIQKAQEAGISKGDTENMLQKLKSSGEVIEASDNRYRVV